MQSLPVRQTFYEARYVGRGWKGLADARDANAQSLGLFCEPFRSAVLNIGPGLVILMEKHVIQLFGSYALSDDTTGSENNAFGWGALASNSIGVANNAVGNATLYRNISGSFNTAIGEGALQKNNTGDYNTASGGDPAQTPTAFLEIVTTISQDFTLNKDGRRFKACARLLRR